MKRNHALTLSLALAAGLACSTHAQTPVPDQPGPFAVGHINFPAIDPVRNRSFDIDVWYPVSPADSQGPATFYDASSLVNFVDQVNLPSVMSREGDLPAMISSPLVVYSHPVMSDTFLGRGFPWDAFPTLELLASHGFIVASINHEPSDGWTTLQESCPDVSFVITTLLDRDSTPNDFFADRIDEASVGVIGFRMGGLTALATAAGLVGYPGDSRVDSIMSIEPQYDFPLPQLQNVSIPAFVLTGTRSSVLDPSNSIFHRISGPQSRLVALRNGMADSFMPYCRLDNHLVTGGYPAATRNAFRTNIPSPCPAGFINEEEAHRLRSKYAVSFFSRTLKSDPAYDTFLTSAHAATEPNVQIFQEGRAQDLNGNGVEDSVDLSSGLSSDANGNGVPDEVDGPVLYVNANATGANTGITWTNALTSLHRAVAMATASRGRVRQVWVAAGTYTPGPAAHRANSLVIPTGLSVYGGFAGGETALEQRQPQVNVTVISGDLSSNDTPNGANRSDNSYRICFLSGLLDGFTITGGNADTGPDSDAAAGLQLLNRGTVKTCRIQNNSSAQLSGGVLVIMCPDGATLQDCTLSSNSSVGGGGLFAASAPGLLIANTTFSRNTATSLGGGLFLGRESNVSADYQVVDCRFQSNSADFGGAIGSVAGGSLNVADTLFENNTARSSGGAALSDEGDQATFTRCTFRSNTASFGGAVQSETSVQNDFLDCLFEGNRAVADAARNVRGSGGALRIGFGSSDRIINCTFRNNTAGSGGALFVDSSGTIANATNCTFTGNAAITALGITGNGGSIYSAGGDTLLTNCSISGSTSTGSGRALFRTGTASSSVRNSILYGNGTPSLVGVTSVQYSIVEGGFAGTGNLNVNPQFINAAAGDLRLQDNSPAIDVADTTLLPTDELDLDGDGDTSERIPFDHDGLARIYGETLDMGAHEFACAADFNLDGGVDGDDVIGFFAAWDAGDLAADFNGDGGVDGDDVIAFFGRWDAGC